jgi:GNAT superfamily N-acetyltransferase
LNEAVPDDACTASGPDARQLCDIRQIVFRHESISDSICLNTKAHACRQDSRITRVNTYDISTDPSRLQLDAIHGYLTRSDWSPGVPRAIVARAAANSLCFGVYHDHAQIGFARVVTDKATFAYLADVYVLEEHRGQGLSKRLVAAILAHPELQGLRRFLLATADAHGLYAQFGFKIVMAPERMMEIKHPDPHGVARPLA